MNINRGAFERLVDEALGALPRPFRDSLDNVEVVIEDWPSPQTLRLAGVHEPAELLGFYHGIPQTRRSHGYSLVLPDKITLYQRPIEMQCWTMAQMRTTIVRVLQHEIGHHLGLDDDRLREIGAY